jgi:hypothetical protein
MDVCTMQSASCLLDQPIREALKKTLRQLDSSAAIIDELPLLRGRGRADLAFVNGELCGYEIKSEADSLVRLGIQADNYESVFEFNTIVAASKHLNLAMKRIPQTWGVVEVVRVNGETELHSKRTPERNYKMSNYALARLLWKNECVPILRRVGIDARHHMPVSKLWTLLETIDTRELCDEVRNALKRRQVRSVLQQTLYDGLRTTVATE